MRLFSPLYDRVMRWSRHPRAPRYLFGLSFAESSFFPIPPDAMLMPMALASPHRAWYLAALTTVASVLGGLFGYLIGYLAFDLVQPLIEQVGYGDHYDRAQEWFAVWGFWTILLVGFSPIPYKVFTIAAGVVVMPLIPFLLGSLLGRGLRFFLVAGLMRWGGEPMERALRRHVDLLGWATVALAVLLYLVIQFR